MYKFVPYSSTKGSNQLHESPRSPSWKPKDSIHSRDTKVTTYKDIRLSSLIYFFKNQSHCFLTFSFHVDIPTTTQVNNMIRFTDLFTFRDSDRIPFLTFSIRYRQTVHLQKSKQVAFFYVSSRGTISRKCLFLCPLKLARPESAIEL